MPASWSLSCCESVGAEDDLTPPPDPASPDPPVSRMDNITIRGKNNDLKTACPVDNLFTDLGCQHKFSTVHKIADKEICGLNLFYLTKYCNSIYYIINLQKNVTLQPTLIQFFFHDIRIL